MNTRFLNRELHRSIGISAVCVGLLGGLGLSSLVIISINAVAITVICILIILLHIRLRITGLVLITILAVFAGLGRGHNVRTELELTAALSGQTNIILGVIEEDPQISARGDQRIILGDLVIDSKQYQGTIWVSTDRAEYKRGDGVLMSGLLQDGFATHQLSIFRPKILKTTRHDDPVISFRDSFSSNVRENVVEPAASLGIGFVIGQKSALPPELEEQLRIVGLTHLVVASGYNLTILIRFAKRAFEKHSRFLVNASSITMVLGFIAVSGASPSMVRASIVSGLSLLVWNYGRVIHPVKLILFVAAITAMVQPLYLWADIGWWLSFLAFFGVLVLSPLMIRLFMHVRKKAENKPSNVAQMISETIAAQLMTLPIILYVFGALPTTAFVANIITAPLIPFAMVVTTLAGIGSMIAPGISFIISLPATILLSYFVAVIRTLSHIPGSLHELSIQLPMMVAVYLVTGIIICLLWWRLHYDFRQHSIID